MKKKFPSLHLNADDFIPATNDEKESLVVMRDRQVVGELRGSDLNQSSIMKTIAGGEQA